MIGLFLAESLVCFCRGAIYSIRRTPATALFLAAALETNLRHHSSRRTLA